MALKLYNTLTKSKEEFRPINPGKVGMYVCGPTVYDYLHPGNLLSYMTADTLRRYFEYLGYEVRMIKNITDVGHLTEDDIAQGDSGDDKIAKKALREKKTPKEIAEFFEDYFHKAEEKINIEKAHYFPRATAHIPQMIKIIFRLIEKGYAYEINGNVFFDVTKFTDYGKLSGNTLENLKVGARLEEHPDKKNPWDFALWLKAPKEHLMKFESPWSLGYPGWHIECSAMSSEYLGDTFDIHTGGEDNIFPHHEAEIAQSEAYSGKKFVNFWVHTRFLLIDGKKMSKSKGNFFTLEDMKEKQYSPMALRLLFLSGHHRSQLNFTWKSLDQAKTNFQRISDWISNLDKINDEKKSNLVDLKRYKKKFEEAMDDDLNTPLALSILFELITETNKLIAEKKLGKEESKNILSFWEKMNKVFGLIITKEEKIPEKISKIAEARKTARENKDFKASDELREKLEKLGYTIEDLKDNKYTIKRK
ncbi:MAG TPA: cysteine--tRNA ligase [Candidatus Moranbacteria bacterium]|nr:cysteine--tRNA ligase [Candidatus Moranbacteria bacterium]